MEELEGKVRRVLVIGKGIGTVISKHRRSCQTSPFDLTRFVRSGSLESELSEELSWTDGSMCELLRHMIDVVSPGFGGNPLAKIGICSWKNLKHSLRDFEI